MYIVGGIMSTLKTSELVFHPHITYVGDTPALKSRSYWALAVIIWTYPEFAKPANMERTYMYNMIKNFITGIQSYRVTFIF